MFFIRDMDYPDYHIHCQKIFPENEPRSSLKDFGFLVISPTLNDNEDVLKLLANAYKHLRDNGILYVSLMPCQRMTRTDGQAYYDPDKPNGPTYGMANKTQNFFTGNTTQTWNIKKGFKITRFNECSSDIGDSAKYTWKSTYLLEKGKKLETFADTVTLRMFMLSEIKLFLDVAGFKSIKFHLVEAAFKTS